MLGNHRTASHLLVILVIVVGLLAVARLNTQFFPDIDSPTIEVEIAWPGASASDVEENILGALEPRLRYLDNLKKIVGIARAGMANITLEFEFGSDMKTAYSTVEQTVQRVTTLPATAERAKITHKKFYDHVATVSISGPYSERVVKSYAKQIRDGLLEAGIDRVDTTGIRDEEIWVHVRGYDLRRLELSIEDVARRIAVNISDLPSGTVVGGINRQLRMLSSRKSAKTIGGIEIKSFGSGQKLFLKDVAQIIPSFDREGKIVLSRAQPAVRLELKRVRSSDTLEMTSILDHQLKASRKDLPRDIRVEVSNIRSKFVAQTLGVLLANGLYGLLLVLMVLFVFLHWRVGVCVAIGIPLALLASLAVMYATGQSLNMISMLALIMMFGIVVDDAIVVSERSEALYSAGFSPSAAVEHGARSMFMPVLAASLTTICAFLPVLFVTGTIGAILAAIPLVVSAVLIASLFECFVILPVHLRRAFGAELKRGKLGRGFDIRFAQFRDGAYCQFLRISNRWRYTAIALSLTAFAFAVAALASGRVGFTFFASPQAENITAVVAFGAGTPRSEQIAALTRIEQAIYEVEARLLEGAGEKFSRKRSNLTRTPNDSEIANGLSNPTGRRSKQQLVESTYITIGKVGQIEGRSSAQIEVQLTPNENRTIHTQTIVDAWRGGLPALAGVEEITILQRRSGPPSRDIDVRLTGAANDKLKLASEDLKMAMSNHPGVSAISDNMPWGEPELVLKLSPRGSALGFTSESVGRQVRNAFEGAIATRFVRGDEEVVVRVMRIQNLPGIAGLRELYLLSPAGDRVPIGEVVQLSERVGFSTIRHINGKRTIAVTGDVDHQMTSVPRVLEHLRSHVLPSLVEKYGIDYEFDGRIIERASSFKDLRFATLFAVILMFIILAWGLESYVRPLLVMAIIPFGLIGAVAGHWLLGFNVTIISIVGFLGLSGVLVSNSIILLTELSRRQERGEALADAAIHASKDRLRAVILTTLTTAVGFSPLLIETNRNAQFLIPLAITIVFGLVVATLLVLVLLPVFAGVTEDLRLTNRVPPGAADNDIRPSRRIADDGLLQLSDGATNHPPADNL